MDVSVAAVIVLAGTVVLRWVIIAVGAVPILQSALACPACFEPTVAVRRRLLTALLRIAEWRWCPQCGCEGPSRKSQRSPWRSKSAQLRA